MGDGAFTWMDDAECDAAEVEINDALRDAGLEHEAPKAKRDPLFWVDPAAMRRAAEIDQIQRIAHLRYGGEWGWPVRHPYRDVIYIRRASDGAEVVVGIPLWGDDGLIWPDEPTIPEIGLVRE